MTHPLLFFTLVNHSTIILFILHLNQPVSFTNKWYNTSLTLLFHTALSQHQALSNVQLVNFVKNGGNILAATGIDPSDNIRALAAEFDIELDTDTVYDHTHFDNNDHSLITTSEFVAPTAIIDAKAIEAPVLYSGTGLNVGQLPLSTAILTAESDAFIADSYNKRTNAVGTVTLAGAMQSRNNARVTFVGSLDVFSDKLISASINVKSEQT